MEGLSKLPNLKGSFWARQVATSKVGLAEGDIQEQTVVPQYAEDYMSTEGESKKGGLAAELRQPLSCNFPRLILVGPERKRESWPIAC